MKLYVERTEQVWEPLPGDPDRYRATRTCTDTCHHPIHAFHPARRRHTEDAHWVELNGVRVHSFKVRKRDHTIKRFVFAWEVLTPEGMQVSTYVTQGEAMAAANTLAASRNPFLVNRARGV